MMERTLAEARAGIPMNAAQVEAAIAEMDRMTKSRAARKRMAEVAVKFAKVTPEGREIWVRYLASFN